MEQASRLEQLDGQALARRHLPTMARMQTLVKALGQARQSGQHWNLDADERHLHIVVEEVTWAAEHVLREIEAMRQLLTPLPPLVRGRLRELARHEQWLVERLEVLHGLVTAPEATD
jgi:hypothetical protein